MSENSFLYQETMIQGDNNNNKHKKVPDNATENVRAVRSGFVP